MFKRVAVFLLLAAAIAAATLYYLHRGPNAAQSPAAPELISLAPAEASYLFYADLAALRSSPFLARILALAPQPSADREYAEFVRATGFDYSRDLDRVVLAVRPAGPGNFTVALAEGRFDRERIIAYALRLGRVERQKGVEVYVVPTTTRAKEIAFAFLGSNRLALADGPSLAPVLAARAPGASDPGMRERILRVAGSAIFALGQVGPVPEGFSLGGVRSDQFTNLVRSVRWFSSAARPEGERMRVAVEAECDTAENARQLAGTLDGLRLLGQAALADPGTRQRIAPQTAAVLEGLLRTAEVSLDHQRVRLLLELTPQMLNAAAPKSPAASRPTR